MRPSLRLLVAPVGVVAVVLVAGVALAPPAGSDADAAAGSATDAEAAAVGPDACAGDPALALAEARHRGMAYDFLRGRSFRTKVTGVGSRAVVLDAGEYRLHDFAAGDDELDSGRLARAAGGLVGAGRDRTDILLSEGTSTRAAAVPSVEYEVNPLNVLRVTSERPVVGGFTLTGSEQGHTYNGLRVERAHGAQVSDVRVVGIPGDMDRPPGETFGINDYKTIASRYEDVEVDGADVGAAGFAANGSQGIVVCDTWSHDNAVSMGFAFWSVEDIVLVDCTATDNGFTGFNFERVSGDVLLVRPKARDNRWDMRVVSDTGSARYTIVDPDLSETQLPGTWTVEVPSTYWQRPSLQRRDEITLIVDGEERPDLLRFVAPY